ncbi:MAG TPA: hypothetical protein DCE41_18980 [Cytophagales bacterium]|nr:hypothetical protein [Cytophagales bacterium]HAA22106.1 hypothetical protein [Cytophagales bacterium]HAP60839.1 hypothetical protein [Cytophagales bacterium]
MVQTSEVLFENRSITLAWDHKGQFLHVEWKGFANNEGYREILLKQIELTREKRARRILYDLRNMGVVSRDNQAYTNEEYFPAVSRAGNKVAAIVVPENVFGEMSVSAIMGARNEALFQAQIFDDPGPAKAWLEKT